MKTITIRLCILVMMLALLGCAAAPVPSASAGESTAPIETAPVIDMEPSKEPSVQPDAPAQLEPYAPLDVTDTLPATYDLDGDGTADTLDFSRIDGGEDAPYRLSVAFGGGQASYSMDTYIITEHPSVWLADMNGDGLTEVYISGDTGSDDYVTYAWRYADGVFGPVRFSGETRTYGCDDGSYLDGDIEAFDGDIFKIGSIIDMLGSYGGFRPYQYQADGSIGPIADTIWDLSANETALKTIREIPVVWVLESGDVAGSITAGSSLTVSGSDGESAVWFTDENGKIGRIELTPNTGEWGYLIDGVPEYECFETLPYAG